jgi:hypothetical protein
MPFVTVSLKMFSSGAPAASAIRIDTASERNEFTAVRKAEPGSPSDGVCASTATSTSSAIA